MIKKSGGPQNPTFFVSKKRKVNQRIISNNQGILRIDFQAISYFTHLKNNLSLKDVFKPENWKVADFQRL